MATELGSKQQNEFTPTLDQYFQVIGGYTSANIARSIKINSNGALEIAPLGLAIPEWDYLTVSYPTATQEVFTFKIGGSGGTTVATITINYTTATKEFISDVTKT